MVRFGVRNLGLAEMRRWSRRLDLDAASDLGRLGLVG